MNKSKFWEKVRHVIFDVKDDTMPKSIAKGKYFFVFCMCFLAVAHLIVFYFGVNIKSILMAFQKVSFNDDGTTSQVWTMENFTRFFREFTYSDSVIPTAFLNTFKYFILSTFILFPISYFISYFLYKKVLGYKVFRVVFYLCGIVSSVVWVILYKSIIRIDGPLSTILYEWFGYEMPSLLTTDSTATGAIMGFMIWTGLAGNFILFTGAMNRIPGELMEVSKIDGCGWVRELFQLVTPLCWDTVGTLFILSFIGIFQASGPILLFNTGESTYTISYWIYLQVTQGSYSFPAAVGLFLTVVSIPIVLVIRALINRVETVEY